MDLQGCYYWAAAMHKEVTFLLARGESRGQYGSLKELYHADQIPQSAFLSPYSCIAASCEALI